MSTDSTVVLDADAITRSVRRIAVEILEVLGSGHVDRDALGGTSDGGIALVGVRRGGVPLAQRIHREMRAADPSVNACVGAIDIAFYRDDAATALPDPKTGPSDIAFDVTGRHVVLVDDVLQTGRTIRAAIDALQDHGRAARIWLAVLCDRGGRELPIAPDFVGRTFSLTPAHRLAVWIDAAGEDRVVLDGDASVLNRGSVRP